MDLRVLLQAIVSGLLTGDKELKFSPHQTIQEYFVARAIKSEVLRVIKKGIVSRLISYLTGEKLGILEYARDPWWSETFIQLTGLFDDADKLVLFLAEINPWLAWWCVQEGSRVSKTTEAKIEAKSARLVGSRRVSERRRAALALSQLRTARVTEPLARLSLDSDSTISQIAVSTLFAMGPQAKKAFDIELMNTSPKFDFAHE